MTRRWSMWLLAVATVLGGCGSKLDVPPTWSCGLEDVSTCQEGQICASDHIEGQITTHYACVPLPDDCGGNPSCDCLTTTMCDGQLAGGGSCGCDTTGCFIDCVAP